MPNVSEPAQAPQYDLDAMAQAAALFDEIYEKSKQARAMMEKAGMTPGLGLSVGLHNVVEYSARVGGQLRTLIKEQRRR